MFFIIIDGLPYLYAEGKAYKCRFDEAGFTPSQEEVEITEEPAEVFSELEIKAQCQCLDSIGGAAEEQAGEPEEVADLLKEMTLDELKEHAKQHDIELGSSRTKADIIAKITAVE